jgi:deoxycytidine triphosphate deaminase
VNRSTPAASSSSRSIPRTIQPSSIDVKIGNLFRVFRNHTSAVIDVKQNQEDLTELITIRDDDAFMLRLGRCMAMSATFTWSSSTPSPFTPSSIMM